MRFALLLFVAAASPAFGQVGTVAIEGVVVQRCAFDTAAPRLAPQAPNNVRALAGNNLEIDTLVDPATLAVRAANADLSFAAMCNVPHIIRIEAQNNGLFRSAGSTAAPSGFANAVPYRARFTWGDQTRTLFADANTRRPREEIIDRPLPTGGTLLMQLDIQPGASNLTANAPLVSGNYAETFRVTIEPRQ
ncbi:Secreted protein [Sphingomonas antarctica]|uniref:hypothetical protein n=1 Tax=Sphingomonas antarctica TaxID=2040274 RepID=UPI0039E83690